MSTVPRITYFSSLHNIFYIIIDIGWTDDPGSIINASDLFILPNRNTYFDLVLLEVLSIGTPVLASRTGGNISVGKLTEGVKLFKNEDVNEIIHNIIFLKNNKEILEYMKKCNKKCYDDYFTLEKFGERYIKIINLISNQ